MRICYYAYYPCDEYGRERIGDLAAQLQSNYLIQVMNELGYSVEIVSPSRSEKDRKYFSLKRGFTKKINELFYVRYLSVIESKSKIIRYIFGYLYIFIELLLDLMNNRSDCLIFYHSSFFYFFYLFLYFSKRRFVVEVEEIYSDISQNQTARKWEVAFLHLATSFILPNKMMAAEIANGKPWVLYHGSCKNEPIMNKVLPENVHHIVYAGTLDPRKMGDLPCVSAAEFLDDSYHIHILGIGFDDNLQRIKKRAASLKAPHCPVTFHDVLYGDDYLAFLQSCDIGLYPQEATYEDINTSFPSKIMSYLSNGLRVVATRTKPLELSEVADLLFFAESGNPKDIADAIKRIDFTKPYNSRKRLDAIHGRLKKDLQKLFATVDKY